MHGNYHQFNHSPTSERHWKADRFQGFKVTGFNFIFRLDDNQMFAREGINRTDCEVTDSARCRNDTAERFAIAAL